MFENDRISHAAGLATDKQPEQCPAAGQPCLSQLSAESRFKCAVISQLTVFFGCGRKASESWMPWRLLAAVPAADRTVQAQTLRVMP